MSEMIPRPIDVGIQRGSLFLCRQSVAEGERDSDAGVAGTVSSPGVAASSFAEAILLVPIGRVFRNFYANK